MYATFKHAQKVLITFVIIFTLLTIIHPVVIYGRTADEITQEKTEKQKELDALNADLKKAEQTLKSNIAKKSSSLNEIDRIKAELAEIDSQLEVNKLTQAQLEKEIGLKSLEREDTERLQDIQIATSYISWKTQDDTALVLGGSDVLKNAIYYDYVTEASKNSIKGLTSELETLTKSNEEYKAQIDKLGKDNTELTARKATLEKQISQIDTNIAQAKNTVGAIKQKISFVSAEQQAILNKEKQLLGSGETIGTLDITSGQMYFAGTGRDIMQGHGVGMSQYGAKGYATNGWSADDILRLYYKGVEVVNYNSLNSAGMNSQISVVYCASNPTTDTPPCDNGQGALVTRVPFDDYLGGLGEMPESWPLEARKAQLIGARTYAINYTNNGSADKPICLTQQCQVNYLKTGGTADDFFHDGDLDVTLQTKDKVIHYQGKLITAVYSSDNSQGFGTADNDTVWSNVSGVGSPYAYLRSVNDSQFAEKTQWTSWAWRTNGYDFNQINGMFTYAAANGYTHAGNVKNAVGNITGFGFVKDPSGRVKVVSVVGDKGSMNMAGWYFKAVWNNWVGNTKPSGQLDYIYSLTWNFQKKE
mgnify:CR=1 FL=1